MESYKRIGNDLNDCTPEHGVAVGNNPNQPKTDIEMEITIQALRLVNVGEFGKAQKVIENTDFSVHQKEWLKKEIRVVLGFLE